MKKYLKALFLVALLSFSGVDAHCATGVRQLLNGALKTLCAQKGDPNICVLTNATYVEVAGGTTEKYVDVIQEETGCSVGNGNLLFYHRPSDHPFVIALYSAKTKECVVIRYDGQKGRSGKLMLDDKLVCKAEFWEEARSGIAGPDAYSILGIVGSWALGAPYDFLKCTDIHGHACPGLAFGYFMVKAIQKRYPLAAGEKYVFIASPVACKDDAIQVLLDLTPGKQGLFVKALTDEQMNQFLPTTRVAGILVRWNKWEKKGQGVVLGLDMEKISEITGFKKPAKKGAPRIIFQLIPHLHRSEEFVKTAKEFPVTQEIMQGLKSAGYNPYDLIGLTRKDPEGEK